MVENIKVLIVEDDEIARDTLAENLRAKGFDVDVAENGAEALLLVKQSHYEILLVDYRLPDTNGLAVIKDSLTVDKETVPIVVTGYSSVENAVDSMRVGAYDYLIKPVNIDALVSEMRIVLNEKESFYEGKANLHNSVIGELKDVNDEDIAILASKDSLIPINKESVLGKIKTIPNKIIRRIKEFYWD
ncbi:MAG: response regulator [Endomicrobia bacterium]|nr:response regulator [Endomicrobiia bacterium]